MLTALCIYLGIGLVFGIFDLILCWGAHGYTFSYKLNSILISLFIWPIYVIGILIILIENIITKRENKRNEQHLHNNSQED